MIAAKTIPTYFLEITNPENFIEELKIRGLKEIRQIEWVQTYNIFQKAKRRFTALDREGNIIIRFDLTFYHDIVIKDDYSREKYEKGLKDHVEPFVKKLEESGFKVLNGEWHRGETFW